MVQSEQQLIDALQQRERRACDQLVERYSSRLYDVALRLTGHPNEAEEVLQETFINACRSVDSFEGRSGLGTWLYRIATNNGLMRLRRKTAPTVSLDVDDEAGAGEFQPRDLTDWRWDPESTALTTDLRSTLDAAVASLPPSLQAAFILRDIEGLSTEEAAEALGISREALKVRLHRARLMLRERLADYVRHAPLVTGEAR
ncbi:MAG: sigma-70 family RNA polymerase sigma factor [Anaerolineae bacterium]|nr:sigma-70 family RNA polymerase sigma factor [Anaerolineae bacterium]